MAPHNDWPEYDIADVAVALDGSKLSEAAVPVAAAIARRFGARASLITVLDEAVESRFADFCRSEQVVLFEAVRAYQARMIRHLRDLGIPAAGHVVAIRGSSAKETLVEVAENLHAGLLVIGSHARAGMERLLLGSVAEGVIRRSGVPVLVIPPAAVIAPVDR